MAKQKTLWHCGECGHKQVKWSGSCTICQKWNTFAEEIEFSDTKKRFESSATKSATPKRIKDIEINEVRRISTKVEEFDRLLGGGIVAGSLTLIGGDPGIGKSTLMLQISHSLAEQGLKVLYICGEESAEQTSLRARRLGISSENL